MREDKRPRAAFVFDACKTLFDGYHPSVILEARGILPSEFWPKVTEMQAMYEKSGIDARWDGIWTALFMNEVRQGKLHGLTIDEIKSYGPKLDSMLFPGLPDFFENIRQDNPDFKISYNVVSVGLRDLIESSVIGSYADRVFGYTFIDNFTEGDTIDEVIGTTSSGEKPAALIGISYGKGKKGKYDYPMKNMIYFADGQTDKAAFSIVRDKGGKCIGVYNPFQKEAREKTKEKIGSYVDDLCPSDYNSGSELYNAVNSFLDKRRSEIRADSSDLLP